MKQPVDTSMQELKPTVWIGKQGCTETMIGEIAGQLKKRKIIKVKWLQSCEVDPEAVAREAGAELVGVRGKTMVLRERKGAKGGTAPGVPERQTAKEKARVSAAPPEKSAEASPRDAGAAKPRRTIGSMGRATRK
ncbi:MAG TPA: YhbY family RNA-binding protein [Methanoregula sp.]|nr:YhbY family RNA-binding protein [Methanoregula sp.]